MPGIGASGTCSRGVSRRILSSRRVTSPRLSRYLHLNPVRAKLARSPEDWKWSSYAGYRRARAALGWVTYERVLGEFGGLGAEARRRYCRFVEAGISDPPAAPWKNAFGGLLVGSESFAMRVRRLLGNRERDQELPQLEPLRARPALERIVAVVAERFGCKADEWASGRRSDAMGRAPPPIWRGDDMDTRRRRSRGCLATVALAASGRPWPASKRPGRLLTRPLPSYRTNSLMSNVGVTPYSPYSLRFDPILPPWPALAA